MSLKAGGGIPCRLNPAATLLVIIITYVKTAAHLACQNDHNDDDDKADRNHDGDKDDKQHEVLGRGRT